MNDYQASKLVDILPPPEITEASQRGGLWLAIAILILLFAAVGAGLRSRGYAKMRLQRQIARQRIDARQAAAEMIKLAPPDDENLHSRLLELRFGPNPPGKAELLDSLSELP